MQRHLMVIPGGGRPRQHNVHLKGRWEYFIAFFLLGLLGWIPAFIGALTAGLVGHLSGFYPVFEGPALRIVLGAGITYLLAAALNACKAFMQALPKSWAWWRWEIVNFCLTCGAALLGGWVVGIRGAPLLVYAVTSAVVAEMVNVVCLRPWRPGPSPELIEARKAALRRGEDPSLITEDDVRPGVSPEWARSGRLRDGRAVFDAARKKTSEPESE